MPFAVQHQPMLCYPDARLRRPFIRSVNVPGGFAIGQPRNDSFKGAPSPNSKHILYPRGLLPLFSTLNMSRISECNNTRRRRTVIRGKISRIARLGKMFVTREPYLPALRKSIWTGAWVAWTNRATVRQIPQLSTCIIPDADRHDQNPLSPINQEHRLVTAGKRMGDFSDFNVKRFVLTTC